jgi:anti-anti-sigma factor
MRSDGGEPGTDEGDEDPGREGREADDEIIEAMGTLGEAYEYLIRARGHLYTFHQLMGRVDFLFGDAADQLAAAGEHEAAERLRTEIVGRNVLDGRWTFQVVEEFDGLYWDTAHDAVRGMERRYQNGQRHLYESSLKDQRRSAGRPGHERRPPRAHADEIETEHDAEAAATPPRTSSDESAPGGPRPDASLVLSTRAERGGVVVRARGEIDLVTSDDLRDELDRAIVVSHGRVCLDGCDVTFVDSTGLRVLVDADRRLADLDRSGLEVRKASPALRRVLAISGLDFSGAEPDTAD